MKLNWIKPFFAAAFALSLVACGGSDDEASTTPVLAVDASGVSSIDAAVLSSTLASYALSPLSTAESDSLAFMRQEEQMAHDVYAASATLYTQPIFTNIATAESTHSAAVKLLLDRYQLPDPIAGLPAGTYPNATIQALHDQFVATSQTNLVAALKVGAQIEELDIRDITNQLAVVDNADITMVYQNLMKGSRNHLRAFVKVLTQQGETYTPQYITQAEFDAIVNSPIETGR